jgi:hypothetical protein
LRRSGEKEGGREGGIEMMEEEVKRKRVEGAGVERVPRGRWRGERKGGGRGLEERWRGGGPVSCKGGQAAVQRSYSGTLQPPLVGMRAEEQRLRSHPR